MLLDILPGLPGVRVLVVDSSTDDVFDWVFTTVWVGTTTLPAPYDLADLIRCELAEGTPANPIISLQWDTERRIGVVTCAEPEPEDCGWGIRMVTTAGLSDWWAGDHWDPNPDCAVRYREDEVSERAGLLATAQNLPVLPCRLDEED